MFNGPENWLQLYKKATPKKYDFAYMKLTNPPRFFRKFEEELPVKSTAQEDLIINEDEKK